LSCHHLDIISEAEFKKTTSIRETEGWPRLYAEKLLNALFRKNGNKNRAVRFEVFTAVTMKNDVFWDVTPSGSCKDRRFGGT
jgi:hypothetical protein